MIFNTDKRYRAVTLASITSCNIGYLLLIIWVTQTSPTKLKLKFDSLTFKTSANLMLILLWRVKPAERSNPLVAHTITAR
jgi:hypothetical protein